MKLDRTRIGFCEVIQLIVSKTVYEWLTCGKLGHGFCEVMNSVGLLSSVALISGFWFSGTVSALYSQLDFVYNSVMADVGEVHDLVGGLCC